MGRRFYGPARLRRGAGLEAPLHADAEVLQPQQPARVARERFGAQRPVGGERVPTEERERPRLELRLPPIDVRHAEARAVGELVGPLHALRWREPEALAPGLRREAESVVLRREPVAR